MFYFSSCGFKTLKALEDENRWFIICLNLRFLAKSYSDLVCFSNLYNPIASVEIGLRFIKKEIHKKYYEELSQN